MVTLQNSLYTANLIEEGLGSINWFIESDLDAFQFVGWVCRFLSLLREVFYSGITVFRLNSPSPNIPKGEDLSYFKGWFYTWIH